LEEVTGGSLKPVPSLASGYTGTTVLKGRPNVNTVIHR